ncbi:hypothetical protein SteCoe_14839 [Stentor coeruleus]|uniref:Uncharacterized protein n=1 Tax=Stentor coeruleus TaxID=5963 RepID=A0A1R2C537_9CILI|nr:hypothetical protein SteCoe_14839 [Stentor coeruleus]
MNSFYSKNKQDRSEELAKLEQKRYENLLSQERANRKNIINATKNSIEEAKYRENLKISKDSNIQITNKISQEESPLYNDPKFLNDDSSSVNFKGNEKKSISSSPSQLLLPKINNNPKIPKTIIKLQKSDMQKYKSELDELEEKEHEIQISLEKINLQAYKRKLIASLQTINEEAREMEESLKKSYTGAVITDNKIEEINLENMKGINLDLESKNYIQPINIDLQNESDKNKQLKSVNKSEIFSNFEDNTSARIEINKEITHKTPEIININAKNKKNIPTNSHYSKYKKNFKKTYALNPEKNNKPIKQRFVSKDFVRVNPNIDIKSLFFS